MVFCWGLRHPRPETNASKIKKKINSNEKKNTYA